MSENLIVSYHLSSSKTPIVDPQGLFKVLQAEFVFNHWQPGQRYLHQVSYSQQAIIDYYEDGHHDAVSSFSWDEFVMVDKVTSQQVWQLDNRASLFSLLQSDFMQDLSSSIFSSQDALHRTILKVVEVDLAIDYIRHAQLSAEDLGNCLTVKHAQLMRKLLKSGLFNEQDFYRGSFTEINWSILTKDKNDFMGETLQSQLGLNDQFEVLLWDLYVPPQRPKSATLTAIMISLLLINDLPWLHYMTPNEKVILPCGLVLMLLRLQQSSCIDTILSHPDIELDYSVAQYSCDLLIDRLAVYQHLNLLQALHNQVGGFDKEQSLRCASSLSATDFRQWQATTFIPLDEQEVINRQQQKKDYSLEQAVTCGHLYLCEAILANNNSSQTDLDSTLLIAAELGYCEIVKRLHKRGGSLQAGGRWPIRYANKFSYPSLKNYLLTQGEEDLCF